MVIDLFSHLPLLVYLHYLGKHEPRNLVSSVMLYTENNNDLACYIFHIYQPILIIFDKKQLRSLSYHKPI